MRKAFRVICLLVTVTALAVSYPALALDMDYAGEWVCVAVDLGDGVKVTQYEGTNVGDLMKARFDADGTLLVTTLGESIPGTWQADGKGVSAVIDGQALAFAYTDGQLVNNANGVTVYLEKAAPQQKAGGLLSLLRGSKYAGKWVAASVDEGDGTLKEEFEGVKVAELIAMQINRDGTLSVTAMGADSKGVWHEIDGGINATINGEALDMLLQDGQLVGSDGGLTVYFRRALQDSQDTAAVTAAPASVPSFAGTWQAVRYETMGYSFDSKMLFPDGCSLTLREDGTAEAFITRDFTEKLSWTQNGEILALSGSYVFSSPVWNGEKEELTMFYGSDAVSVVFKKGLDTAPPVTSAPISEPTPAPSPAPAEETTPAPTPVPTPEPAATAVPSSTNDEPLLCETNLFTLRFFGEGWAENQGWRSDREDYAAVRYELMDADGSVTASLALTASSEGVRAYRDKIKQLNEYAAQAGKETTGRADIGGIAFSAVSYEKWGWQYAEYAARVPESRVTLLLTVEQPEHIGGKLQQILDSIAFKLPVLNPANVDPPLPEDGVPYQPAPSSAVIGQAQLKAAWLKADRSIILDSTFNNHIALSGKRLYVLAGKTLYAYLMDGYDLVPDQTFAGGKMTFDDKYEYLAAGKDGILYVSNGIFNTLAVKDGAVIKDNNLSGYLAMHPGGQWGISFWVNAEPMLVKASGGELTGEPWVLSNLSDAAKRQGRFSAISCVAISDTRIYAAGTDAQKGDAQRVAVYDLEGGELFTFGSEDWMADDAFGSVTAIVETSAGILVQDGNYRAYKLFSHQGEFLGMAESDKLLGTDYPWLSSMIPYDGGVLTAAAQSRQDESGDELLIFAVSGL